MGPCLLLVWCSVLFFYGITVGTLYRTESLRAIIGQSALDGNWLTPTLYGEPFLTKPPGMYVAIGALSLPFGQVTSATARLPGAIAATILVFAFYYSFRRYLEETKALLAAAMLPVSLVWLDKAPSAEIDMLQVMWVALSLLCFLRAFELDENRLEGTSSSTGWWMAAFVAVALGFLTKWTAPAFFYLSVIPFLAWRQRLRLLVSWRHLLGMFSAIALVGIWALAVVAQTGPDLLMDTFLREATQRFEPQHHGRAYPWRESLAYPFVVLAATFPWSGLALLAARPTWLRAQTEPMQRLVQFLHCWTWPSLLFWSLPGQHAVRYALPLCPGMIALGVTVLLSWIKAPRNYLPVVVLATWLVVKIVFVEALLPSRTQKSAVQETARTLSSLVPDGQILYLCKLKDEGVLFYYRRPARRFHEDRLPAAEYYAVLTEDEWLKRDQLGVVETIRWLRDQQGAALVLVKVDPHANKIEQSVARRN